MSHILDWAETGMNWEQGCAVQKLVMKAANELKKDRVDPGLVAALACYLHGGEEGADGMYTQTSATKAIAIVRYGWNTAKILLPGFFEEEDEDYVPVGKDVKETGWDTIEGLTSIAKDVDDKELFPHLYDEKGNSLI